MLATPSKQSGFLVRGLQLRIQTVVVHVCSERSTPHVMIRPMAPHSEDTKQADPRLDMGIAL